MGTGVEAVKGSCSRGEGGESVGQCVRGRKWGLSSTRTVFFFWVEGGYGWPGEGNGGADCNGREGLEAFAL